MSHDGKKCSCGCSSLYSVHVTVPADGEDGTVHEVTAKVQFSTRIQQHTKSRFLTRKGAERDQTEVLQEGEMDLWRHLT